MKIIISLLLTLALALYAYFKKALTIKGIVFAFLFTFVITLFAGYQFFVLIFLVFFIDKLFAKITKKKSDKTRNERQIVANLGMSLIGGICYQTFNKDLFLVVIAACLAGSLSDTLASTIGRMSKKCFDIIGFKKGTPGLSGNISFLGLGASLLGSLIIANGYFYLVNSNYSVYWLITILGFLGSITDSIIGSIFQVKYECKKCHIMTEDRKHCGTLTKKIKGVSIVDNDIVNFLESVVIFIICLLVL